jgi:acyl-CoA synthetase (AMP-forming)/AMP-acid ligase II
MTKHETPTAPAADDLSVVRGGPLSEMPGLGALTLPGVLRELVNRYGPNEAMVARRPDGSVERWSYTDLWDQSMAVARALIASGVTSHSRVGILITQRLEWLPTFFGIGLAGATAVTLSTFSTPDELDYLLKASGCCTVVFERKVVKKDFAEMLTSLEPAIASAEPGRLASLKYPSLRRLVVTDAGPAQGAIETWASFIARGAAVSPELVEATAAAVTRADPGVLFFSSGSTGRSKGILSPHQAVAIQFWRWGRFMGLKDNVRTVSANAFAWSGNFCQTVAATLSSGGSLILQPVFDAAEMLRLIEAERATYPVAWPHQSAQLIDAPNWATTDLSSLRYVDVDSPLARHPTVTTTHRDPMASYGNTETFTIVAGYDAGTPVEIAGTNHGPPLEGCTIKIVDPETGVTVPRGERGEIAAKGPTLMLGYVGVPIGETLDAEGFYRCGDGGYIDAGGRMVFEGRINDIMKTGGANVSPIEVNRILETCPGVKACYTVGVPHETLGEMVVACVAPFESAVVDEESVRAFLKERLASYKVPRRVLFVAEEDLSLTGSAKVKTNALRELAAKRLSAETA